MKKLLISATLSSLLAAGAIFYWKNTTEILGNQQAAIFESLEKQTPPSEPEQKENTLGETPHIVASPSEITEPIAEFRDRITKKPFGIYITPQTSPVQPDKFAGYHTGVDVEYADILEDVPVRAIADGNVILSKYASGYGGVVVILHDIGGEKILALYGHLDPASMLPAHAQIKQGQTIGILGEGLTQETDGARKHLHFAILKKDKLDIRGYVKTKEELAEWYDPLTIFVTHPSPLLP